MAVELHLKRPDKAPWGFRLAGGADFDVPLTVIKVAPGSLAENGGIQVGDVVVRINDTAISTLTHAQAHDVIVNSGNDFVIAVRRGDLSTLPSRLLLYETDVENDIPPKSRTAKTDQQSNDADLNITDEEIANIIGDHVHSSHRKESQNVEVAQGIHRSEVSKAVFEDELEESLEASQEIKIQQSEVAKVIIKEESQQEKQDKKWSTFLQKPKNPKPQPKPKEVEGPKAPPYRVVIKKQPKKGQVPPEGNIQKTEKQTEATYDGENDQESLETKEVEERQVNGDYEEAVQEDGEPDEETTQDERGEEFKQEGEEEEDEEDMEERLRQLQSEKKLSVNLEEQLAEVQKQLLLLSKLPSAIQQTLNAVTQQLSELVAASQQEVSIETNIRIEEEETIEEQTGSVEYHEQGLSVLEEASCEEEEMGQVTFEEAARTESEDEQALFEALERECELESQIMTEEELEAHQQEQERLEKREKVNQWNDIWPWCDEDKPVYRINFLKYQPPPKNLDYLQKSAVYRLIHDIEPPARGIVNRDIKILSEQDYYGQVEETRSTDLI